MDIRNSKREEMQGELTKKDYKKPEVKPCGNIMELTRESGSDVNDGNGAGPLDVGTS